jgi:hypothetical protein
MYGASSGLIIGVVWCRSALAGPINQRKRGDGTSVNQEEPGISMDNPQVRGDG